MRRALRATACGTAALLTACWRIGEPTPGAALVTWAAYPETVIVGQAFSFEFAGPVAHNTCGRLDTATLAVTDTSIELAARRSTFRAMCARQRVSFYEARSLVLRRPGRYAVRTADGRSFGTLTAVDSGRFARMRAVGDGTVQGAGGCVLFGPGWMGNQRPFALHGAPAAIAAQQETDRVVHVEGRLAGFTLCSRYGSRPVIRVDTAWVTEREATRYYP
ncbi:MAG: hypothetical protein ACE5HP_01590 [Gemmatimonadota bacterium]